MEERVAVEEQDVARVRCLYGSVVGTSEAGVLRVDHEGDVRKLSPNELRTAVGGRVVNHDDTCITRRDMRQQPRQAGSQQIAGVVVDDDDCQFRHAA